MVTAIAFLLMVFVGMLRARYDINDPVADRTYLLIVGFILFLFALFHEEVGKEIVLWWATLCTVYLATASLGRKFRNWLKNRREGKNLSPI